MLLYLRPREGIQCSYRYYGVYRFVFGSLEYLRQGGGSDKWEFLSLHRGGYPSYHRRLVNIPSCLPGGRGYTRT
jgi:hypothetical protein